MGVIVNADDFGKSTDINEAIDLSFSKGLIDRTTLMTNMPAAKEAMSIAKDKGYAQKVGIHLNLTQGVPLTKEMQMDPVMCNSEGVFTANFARNLKTRFFVPKSTAENINRELRAQLDEYKKLGGTLWHIDSHHHVHTDYSVWRQLKKVLKDYPVTSVRLSRNMYRGGNKLMKIYKWLLNASIRKFCQSNCDLFGSKADYEEYIKAFDDRKLEELKGTNNIEIMVHPMFDDKGELICE